MYSSRGAFSSIAGGGVGRRGHGGREYKPPRQRRNNGEDIVPPPLKECNCLVQLDIPEYAEPVVEAVGAVVASSPTTATAATGTNDGHDASGTFAPQPPSRQGRLHRSFRGGDNSDGFRGGNDGSGGHRNTNRNSRRRAVQDCERKLRSTFGVHLILPGRNQGGPVAIVSRTYHEALPAVSYLLRQLDWTVLDVAYVASGRAAGRLPGRIQRNVKDPTDPILSGSFLAAPETSIESGGGQETLQPYWLFVSETWTVMASPLTLVVTGTGSDHETTDSTPPNASTTTEMLQTCLDNVRFRLGNSCLKELDIFLREDNDQPTAFAAGNLGPVTALFHEIQQAFAVEMAATTGTDGNSN